MIGEGDQLEGHEATPARTDLVKRQWVRAVPHGALRARVRSVPV